MDALTSPARTAIDIGLASCHACELLLPMPDRDASCRCPRCGATVRHRLPRSLERTSAILVAAAIFYVPANVLPVLSTTTLYGSEADTILEGIVSLYQSGSWVIALIVLVASVMIPIGKIATLGGLVWLASRGGMADPRQSTRLFRLVQFIGRWSILDVFVAALVVGLVQFGPLMSARPGPGIAFFAATAVLTILAADAFDPRLLWNRRPAERSHAA